MIGDLRAVEALATGQDDADSSDPALAAGHDALAEWRPARADMTAALGSSGLARLMPLLWGRQMPFGEFLERYSVEILVHTWDLREPRAKMPRWIPACSAMHWHRP